MREQYDYGNLIRRVLGQWMLILTISITASMLAGIVTSRLYRPSYQTQALIVVYSRQGSGMGTSAALDATSTFQEIITSNLLQKKIAEQLGISALPGSLSCDVIYNTNMITVKAAADSPKNVMIVIDGFLEHYNVVTEDLLANTVLYVLEEPVVPTAPIAAYNETKVMAAAFLASAAGLCALLLLYYYLRDDIKNEYHVEQKLDTKLFSTVYHESKGLALSLPFKKKKKTGLLITNPVSSFGYTETFQKMATRLMYQAKRGGHQAVLVTSVQENEGKSTVAANLALALAKAGKKVVLVDLDFRKPAIYKLFEIPYEKDHTQVGDVITGKAELEDSVITWENPEMYILAGNRSYKNSAKMLFTEDSVRMIDQLKQEVDYVIIDTPPLWSVVDAEEIMRFTDAGLLVVRQYNTKTKDINDAIDIFKSTGCHLLGCVFNDVQVGFTGNPVLKRNNYNYRYNYGSYYGRKKED